MRDYLREIWEQRPGAMIGAAIGVLWSLLAVKIGFFAALFVLIIGLVGWFIGLRHDLEHADWGELLERLFSKERD